MAHGRERPFGVTLLGILYLLNGLLWLIMPFLFGLILEGLIGDYIDVSVAGLTLVCWIPFIIIALFYFIVAFGLFAGSGWARIIAIILAIFGLFNFPIGTILNIIVLIYLFNADVKNYFR